jgi:hypothetical protein
VSEIIYITASNRNHFRHSHIARCERLRTHDGAAINHITSPQTLCGENVVESRAFSNAWAWFRGPGKKEACRECMDRLTDIKLEEAGVLA